MEQQIQTKFDAMVEKMVEPMRRMTSFVQAEPSSADDTPRGLIPLADASSPLGLIPTKGNRFYVDSRGYSNNFSFGCFIRGVH